MAEEIIKGASSEVKILAPDLSLMKKLVGVNLDQLFSKQVIAEAQESIASSSDELIAESMEDLKKLKISIGALGKSSSPKQTLADIIAASFAIKSKAALGGYDLIATIANSLNIRCETLGEESLASANLVYVQWHCQSLESLLSLRIKGSGGAVGEAILKEIGKLTVTLPLPIRTE